MIEADLIDAILRQSVELQRLSQGEEAKAAAILTALEDDLRALLNQGNLSAKSKREIEALIKEAHKAITGQYVNIAGVLDLEAVVQHVADQTVDFLDETFPIAIGNPSIATLQSLSRDILIDGSPASAWWAKQADDTAFRFAGNVRRGVLEGKTNEQIVRDVVADMDVSRRNARTLVHSSIMTAANQARLATYKKNMKGAMGVRRLATLDSSTCWDAGTLVLMADGEWRKISEIREGEMVIGGITGEPHKVLATIKTVAQSSVVIHCDGRYVGCATEDHEIYTPHGWREVGSLAVPADFSEWKVLCRGDKAPEREVPGAPAERGKWEAVRAISGVEEVRRAQNEDHRESVGLRDGACDGSCPDQPVRHEGTPRLQYDIGRGRVSRGRSQSGMAREDNGQQSAARSRSSERDCAEGANRSPLDGSGAAGKDECREGGQAGGTTLRSRVEGEAGREMSGDYAVEMARPRVSGEDASEETACLIDRDAEDCGSQAPLHHDAGTALGIGAKELGNPQGVKVGLITTQVLHGEVEVYDLTVDGDHSYVAGGIIAHNCHTCANLDGSEWDFDGNKLGKTRMDYIAAPVHWACRCIDSPIPNYAALNEISPGLGDRLKASGERASSNGPLKSGTTFADFLKRQPDAWVREYLGAERAELYLSGKITLSDLVTKGGREKTLEELAR